MQLESIPGGQAKHFNKTGNSFAPNTGVQNL
jgi:hypothetical protein